MPSGCAAEPRASSTLEDRPTTGCGRPAVPRRTCLGLHGPRVRTLLVTGHTGFVGRTVPGVLHASQDRWRLVTLPDGFDVRSRELTRHLVDLRPDAVLHLGGLTSVAESYRNPDQFFDVNF